MSWNSLEAEANDIQPTAPVGWSINWFPGGDARNPVAAMVTAVEGPGKVAVVVFAPGAFPVHHKGVHYLHHPLAKRPGGQVNRCGTWDYLPDSGKIPSSHLNLHKEIVAKKKAGLEQAEADRRKREEQAKEGTKKPALATI